MTMTTQEVASIIREIVAKQGEVLGSRLAMLLKEQVPDWNAETYGVRNLREFIATNLQDVQIAGRSGMDVVYRHADYHGPEQTQQDLPNTDYWRIWVSPNSPYVLSIDQRTGAVSAVHRSDDIPDGHLRFEPATVEDHRTIAREFLTKIPGDVQSRLCSIADSSEPTWWRSWLDEVRAIGQLEAWNSFRHDQLLSVLSTRLSDAGLAPAVVNAVVRTILNRPRRAKGTRRAQIPAERIPTLSREIAKYCIEHMSEHELRELRLPLGLVIEAMAKLTS